MEKTDAARPSVAAHVAFYLSLLLACLVVWTLGALFWTDLWHLLSSVATWLVWALTPVVTLGGLL